MTTKGTKIKVIGRREYIDFPLLNIYQVEAKVDTGAYSCALSCKSISVKNINNKSILCFVLFNDLAYEIEDFGFKTIKNSFGESEERYVFKTLVVVGKKKIQAKISLTNRDNMRYSVLIGRRLLKGKFVVDVNLIHTSGISIKKYIQHLSA